ncbi:hypothetical protein ACFL1H_06075 [Nanoarchaeota archaeon]
MVNIFIPNYVDVAVIGRTARFWTEKPDHLNSHESLGLYTGIGRIDHWILIDNYNKMIKNKRCDPYYENWLKKAEESKIRSNHPIFEVNTLYALEEICADKPYGMEFIIKNVEVIGCTEIQINALGYKKFDDFM